MKPNMAPIKITLTKDGFTVTREPCPVCGEPPFGDEYCCNHDKAALERARGRAWQEEMRRG